MRDLVLQVGLPQGVDGRPRTHEGNVIGRTRGIAAQTIGGVETDIGAKARQRSGVSIDVAAQREGALIDGFTAEKAIEVVGTNLTVDGAIGDQALQGIGAAGGSVSGGAEARQGQQHGQSGGAVLEQHEHSPLRCFYDRRMLARQCDALMTDL